jgi:hypothetical protein
MLLFVLRNSYAWLRAGRRPKQKRLALWSGALRVLKGRNSPHRESSPEYVTEEVLDVELFESGGEAPWGCLCHANSIRPCSSKQWRLFRPETSHDCAAETEPGPSSGQTESPPQDHLEDIASLRSQREANSDLTSLFIHSVGNPLCVRAIAGSFPLTA